MCPRLEEKEEELEVSPFGSNRFIQRKYSTIDIGDS